MADQALAEDGRLVANLMHFARTLRAAGLPIGPGKVIDAVAAVRAVGITNRADFYWTLHAVFVNRPDQRPLFDQAFHVFWRNPELLKKMTARSNTVEQAFNKYRAQVDGKDMTENEVRKVLKESKDSARRKEVWDWRFQARRR